MKDEFWVYQGDIVELSFPYDTNDSFYEMDSE